MSKLITDLTEPTAIAAIEILYKIMDNPFLLTAIITFPVVIVMLIAYRYEQGKAKRRSILASQGIDETTETLYWVVTGKKKPLNVKLKGSS